MESSGVWTPTGVPMQDFGGMGSRERTIEPRIDDDADMMGMQFNVTQYAFDRMITDGQSTGLPALLDNSIACAVRKPIAFSWPRQPGPLRSPRKSSTNNIPSMFLESEQAPTCTTP